MSKAGDLVGLPVMSVPDLKRLGEVQEVLFSPDGRQVRGLRLAAGWFAHAKILDFKGVRAFGETHVLAEEAYLADTEATKCREELHGLPVLLPDGAEAGLMDDAIFDELTGEVMALQLSRGFVDDLLHGKSLVWVDGDVWAGEAAILLNSPDDFRRGDEAREMPEL